MEIMIITLSGYLQHILMIEKDWLLTESNAEKAWLAWVWSINVTLIIGGVRAWLEGMRIWRIDFNFIDKIKTVIYCGTLLMDYGKLVLSGTGTS